MCRIAVDFYIFSDLTTTLLSQMSTIFKSLLIVRLLQLNSYRAIISEWDGSWITFCQLLFLLSSIHQLPIFPGVCQPRVPLQATGPFLHMGALAAVTALSWIVAGQVARAEKPGMAVSATRTTFVYIK